MQPITRVRPGAVATAAVASESALCKRSTPT